MLPPPTRPQVGRRLTEVVILSGSVVRIWDVLERVLAKHEMELSKADRLTSQVAALLAQKPLLTLAVARASEDVTCKQLTNWGGSLGEC